MRGHQLVCDPVPRVSSTLLPSSPISVTNIGQCIPTRHTPTHFTMGPRTVLSLFSVLLLLPCSVNNALCLDTSSMSHLGAREHHLETIECRQAEAEWRCHPTTCCMRAPMHKCLANYTEDQLLTMRDSDQWSCNVRANSTVRSLFKLMPQTQCAAHKRSTKYQMEQWSPANVELLQAVAKISILVLLKIIIKYYIRGYLKAHIASKAVFELVELCSKALTIAIAKLAIKWVLYSALRTAAKTFLIASLKALLKPFTGPLLKGAKGSSVGALARSVGFTLSLTVKVLIKTVALEMLVLVFENEATQLPLYQLMFRVSLILLVKMSAKRVCKLGKVKSKHPKDSYDPADTSAPVDKIMMFAIQKLVTKLVKIPLIKMLL